MSRRFVLALIVAFAFACAPAAGAKAPPPLVYVELVTAGAAPDEPLPLIVAVHGLGDRPEDFALLLRDLPVKARVIVPRAPTPHGRGFSWFPVRIPYRDDQPEMVDGVRSATGQLVELLERVARARPTLGRPILMGFSQGGILTFAVVSARPGLLSAAFPVAGALPATLWPAPVASSTVVHAFHGDADPVVPVSAARQIVAELRRQGWDASIGTFRAVPHALPPMMRAALSAEIAGAVRRAALTEGAAPIP